MPHAARQSVQHQPPLPPTQAPAFPRASYAGPAELHVTELSCRDGTFMSGQNFPAKCVFKKVHASLHSLHDVACACRSAGAAAAQVSGTAGGRRPTLSLTCPSMPQPISPSASTPSERPSRLLAWAGVKWRSSSTRSRWEPSTAEERAAWLSKRSSGDTGVRVGVGEDSSSTARRDIGSSYGSCRACVCVCVSWGGNGGWGPGNLLRGYEPRHIHCPHPPAR